MKDNSFKVHFWLVCPNLQPLCQLSSFHLSHVLQNINSAFNEAEKLLLLRSWGPARLTFCVEPIKTHLT